MLWIIYLGGLALVAFIVLPMLADEKTQLFRRVWSSERAGTSDPRIAAAQDEAITQLVRKYGLTSIHDQKKLRDATLNLLSDAMIFDRKYSVNFGVIVAPVVANRIRAKFPKIEECFNGATPI